MPLEGLEFPRSAAEHRIGGGRVAQADGHHPQLGTRAAGDPCAEAGGKQLRSQADAPVGPPGGDRLGDQRLLGGEPWVGIVFIGAHRAAHHDDPSVPSPVR